MFEIVIDYTTGDSFNTNRKTESIEGTWSDMEILKENLQRIKEHYEWYVSIHSTWKRTSKNKDKPVCAVDDYSLMLKLDNGKEYQVHAFWCGYFEILHGVHLKAVDIGFDL